MTIIVYIILDYVCSKFDLPSLRLNQKLRASNLS